MNVESKYSDLTEETALCSAGAACVRYDWDGEGEIEVTDNKLDRIGINGQSVYDGDRLLMSVSAFIDFAQRIGDISGNSVEMFGFSEVAAVRVEQPEGSDRLPISVFSPSNPSAILQFSDVEVANLTEEAMGWNNGVPPVISGNQDMLEKPHLLKKVLNQPTPFTDTFNPV